MSERKVLNKYYPPDFDPSKIPKLKLARNRQYSIRIMAPFNMRCETCGEYIYKGKKFNSRKETVENEDYLGLRIFRFYIKCPRCVAEIAFKTDPKNTDYELEGGATRNFEASRTAMEMAQKEAKAIEEEEMNNPMKVLENRTKASRNEMDMIESLEDLRDLNARHAKVDHDKMIGVYRKYEQQMKKLQEDEDEALVKSVFGSETAIKRLADEDSDDEDDDEPVTKKLTAEKPTDYLTAGSEGSSESSTTNKSTVTSKTPATLKPNSKINLKNLVRKKQTTKTSTMPSNQQSPSNSSNVQSNASNVQSNTSKVQPNSSEKQSINNSGTKDLSDKTESTKPVITKPTGLGLLGNYSGSESSDDNS